MLQAVSIPDVLPSALPPDSNFSLVAGEFRHFRVQIAHNKETFFPGDFEEIYGTETDPGEPQSGKWDAILTCFFIDTVSSPFLPFYRYRLLVQFFFLMCPWLRLKTS